MKVHFKELIDEIDELIEFMTSETWEYYGTQNQKPERIRESFENQYFTGDNCKTFWVIIDEDTKVGTVRVYDLEDGDPMFDIRILNKYKGMGIGTTAVKWLTDYVFNNYPDKARIEANTRNDNYGMRCVFHKSGYVKEAYHRKAWPCSNGETYDAIGYAITKEDWESGKTTLIDWNDFKY